MSAVNSWSRYTVRPSFRVSWNLRHHVSHSVPQNNSILPRLRQRGTHTKLYLQPLPKLICTIPMTPDGMRAGQPSQVAQHQNT